MLKTLIQRIKDYFWYESKPQTGGWSIKTFSREEEFLCIDDLSNKTLEEVKSEVQNHFK
jgi:hypothetical protein